MNIDTDSLVLFLFAWTIPFFMMRRAYLKMDADDQRSAVDDFKSRRFIFTIGFVVLGFFFLHLSSLLSVTPLKTIGVFIFVAGGIFSVIDTWRISKPRSLVMFALMCLMIYLNVD
ncbi:hypothetical protein [Planococcus soli]|uniref:hypothetical protein n=1 Tax=Planococcus soli TaxID=2666072 RepID=UPI00115C9EBF|nr:hypothetical protein [Planococcus soli]